jgi:hypothetical protein
MLGHQYPLPVPFSRPPSASSMRSAGTGMAIYARDIGFVDGVNGEYRKQFQPLLADEPSVGFRRGPNLLFPTTRHMGR